MTQRFESASTKASTLAGILEGFASLDAEEAEILTDLFIDTTRKAMERHLIQHSRH